VSAPSAEFLNGALGRRCAFPEYFGVVSLVQKSVLQSK
jgi:hypothetical protein